MAGGPLSRRSYRAGERDGLESKERRSYDAGMNARAVAVLISILLLTGCANQERGVASTTAPGARPEILRIASWNLEFLAEKNGSGCRPRQDADYVQMRAVADSLDADVIAFEEAENLAAAARVFDPARYTLVMEDRPGKPGG